MKRIQHLILVAVLLLGICGCTMKRGNVSNNEIENLEDVTEKDNINKSGDSKEEDSTTKSEDTKEEENATVSEGTKEEKNDLEDIILSVDFASENITDYEEFIADQDEPQSRVLFSVDRDVNHFKILSIHFVDFDENGKMIFTTDELYTLDTLTANRPLIVGMTFVGAIPNYGISYEDQNGETKYYAVDISGNDGSLFLSDFILQ